MQAIEKLLNLTFDILDRELSLFVIMNKYDEIPYTLPSDIDICVSQNDFDRLDNVIEILANKIELSVTQKIWHNYRKCAYILTPLSVVEPFRLQLDFFSDFSVKSTPLLIPYQEMLRKTRRYSRFTVPDYDMEFTFLLFRRIYKNDFDMEHCEILRKVLVHDEKGIIAYTSKYLSRNTIEKVAKLLISKEYTHLLSLRFLLWNEVKRLSRKNAKTVYFVRYWLSQIKRTIYRIHYPVGMSIAFLSPDGGGKSTIIDNIRTTCWGSFHGIIIRYFRPRLLANLGHYCFLKPKEESITNPFPHDCKQDNTIKSFLRFMFYNLDFLFGSILINKLKVQKKLIIFDRYYFDYYVDMKRYRLKLSQCIPRIFSWMIPKPDITFILIGDAKILYKRKQELSIDELARQLQSFKEIKGRIKNSEFVDANASIDNVVNTVTKQILLHKAQLTAKAMNMTIDSKGIPLATRKAKYS